MDRFLNKLAGSRLAIVYVLGTSIGCVANPVPIPTLWDKLGIPQAHAILRDSTINRSGRHPGLEKKPPLLKIADPANLKPEKPEMIQVAAKIKTEQDQKKQKIKAIKFLADVNCGCYNKDDAVAKAFLAALDDCDPDVRMAAIEGLSKAAGSCSKCKTGCETTCCTEDIYKKLQDIATGVDAKGCFKEPVKAIRTAAAGLMRACGCPTPKPLEELPAPAPNEIEELTTPDPVPPGREGDGPMPSKPGREGDVTRAGKTSAKGVSYKVRGAEFIEGGEPVVVSIRGSSSKPGNEISNPDQLITARVVNMSKRLGEVLVELPDVYQMSVGWTMVVVDAKGKHQVGRITDASGRRILLSLETEVAINPEVGRNVRIGLVKM